MPELRQNMATKEWVIIATERAKRPEEFARPEEEAQEVQPSYDPHCPFCPGNEELELEALRLPDTGPWQVRVIRNKYPALQREGPRERSFDGVHRLISGVGYHEVLVETPQHNLCPALETPDDLERMLLAFRTRGRAISRDERIQHVTYFKNHGPLAGSSLHHPHTQLIALPIVPYSLRARIEEAYRFFDDVGGCVYCRMVQDECEDGIRIVAENEQFVAFVPYAAASPFHVWILPRQHRASFLAVPAVERRALAELLHEVLRRLYVGLNDPDYNYIIHSQPLRDSGDDYLHWYVAIVPRTSRTAGFELGSGMFINSALPEESAAFLRNVVL